MVRTALVMMLIVGIPAGAAEAQTVIAKAESHARAASQRQPQPRIWAPRHRSHDSELNGVLMGAAVGAVLGVLMAESVEDVSPLCLGVAVGPSRCCKAGSTGAMFERLA